MTYIPRVGILIGHHFPREGNFGMVAISENGECLEKLLCATRTGGYITAFPCPRMGLSDTYDIYHCSGVGILSFL